MMKRAIVGLLALAVVGCGSGKPSPTVVSVMSRLCSGGGSVILTGTHLRLDTTVTLTNVSDAAMTYTSLLPNMGVTCSGSATSPDCTVLSASFGPVVAGSYNLTASNGGKPVPSPSNPIVVGPDPLVVFADPDVVWNGIDTPVHVYLSQLQPPITRIQIVPAAGGAAIDLTNLVTPVGGHPDQAIATVPAGTVAGSYDVLLTDSGVCTPAVLSGGLKVVGDTALMLADITPKFGWREVGVPVTLTAKAGSVFTEVPRVYLIQGAVAVSLTSVARFSPTSLTAVVPKDSMRATGAWDVVVVNQDGTVGRLASAFTVTASEPPVVSDVSPATVATSSAATTVTITGRNFSTPPPTVTLKCMDPGDPRPVAGAPVMPKPVTPDQGPLTAAAGATATKLTVTVNGSLAGYAKGANCVVVVTNQDAGAATAEFASLVMVPNNSNLTGFFDGKDLVTGRRGLAAVAGQATQSARFIYAIAGDNAAALPTVETLPVNIFGQPGTAGFFVQKYALNTARTQLGAVRVGRFIYVVGGAGTTALDSIERAAILDPTVHPDNLNADYNLHASAGLDAGAYYYRIAALLDDSDPFNPGGETLPSDAFGVRVPAAIGTNKLQVALSWDVVTHARGYRLYRTNAGDGPGLEQLLVDTTAAATPTGVACRAIGTTRYECKDTGALAAMPLERPLPLGSTGVWKTIAQTMRAKRRGPAVTVALDPDATVPKAYLYVFGGKDESDALLNSYEYLPITIASDASQTTAAFLPAALPTYGAARWKLRAWSEIMGGVPYVWVGGGFTDAAATTISVDVHGTQVPTGGSLGAFTNSLMANQGAAGFAAFSLGNFLFSVGGTVPLGVGTTQITDDGSSVLVAAPPALTGWNSCQGCLNLKRTDLGAAVQSGYFWVVSGDTPTGITKKTEYVLY